MYSARPLLAVLAIIAAINVAVFVAMSFFFAPVAVKSSSMRPALRSGDRMLIDRQFSAKDIRRFDIVVIRTKRGDSNRIRIPTTSKSGDSYIVKRVIALPGESLQAVNGVVAIDDVHQLKEPYAEWGSADSSIPRQIISDDSFWVMGDNRDSSTDSREFGEVPEDAIIGIVRTRFWPVGRFGSIHVPRDEF